MEFDVNKPIYIQIADNICERIMVGELKPAGRIPSVREWGALIGVNPNTVARSYELLSSRGVIINQRGIGYFVTNDALDVIRNSAIKQFIEVELPTFKNRAAMLGIKLEELL